MWNQALSIATVIVASSSAIIFLIISYGRKDMALWFVSASFLSAAVAFALYMGQGSIDPWISVVFANTLLFISHLLLGCGFRVFSGMQTPWPKRFFVYECAVAVLIIVFQFIVKSYPLRLIVMSGSLACCGFEYLAALTNKATKMPKRTIRTVCFFMLVFMFFHLSRIVVMLTMRSDATSLMDADGLTTYTFLMTITIFICWGGSVMLLDTSQLLSEMEAKNDMLVKLAMYDKLTGLFNRHTLDSTIQKEMDRQDRYHTPLALVMLDIDHFKRINDLYGHDNGDRVLIEVAQRVHSSIRETDMLFRWGGEEFLILSPNTNDEGAGLLAEKLRHAIMSTPVEPAGLVTASFGVAERMDNETRDLWFHRVDQAMYRAKNTGRNRVEIWNRDHQTEFSNITIGWQKAWESGDPIIDREHRELIRLGNELINHIVSRESIRVTERQLDELVKHIRTHFADEELILEKAGYAQLPAHREIHKALIAEAESIREQFRSNPEDPRPLFSLLVNRIIMEHMLSADTMFFGCLAENRKMDVAR
jgi:diguanylate cyclase (GGDEF)-like protein/hemerythrin-like metal-binding protein